MQNPSYVTLFQAYPAVRGRPRTRQNPYDREEAEPENPDELLNRPPIGTTVEEVVAPIVAPPMTETLKPKEPTLPTPKKKRVVLKKKKPVQPSIAAHIQPYNIVNDLQQQKANITFGQLFQISPKLRSDAGKSLRKPTVRSAKFSHQVSPSTTAMYCDATIHSRKIPLILDNGAAGSIVSCELLNDLGIPIDRPSTTLMINVNGERKRPLGEVLEFPSLYKEYRFLLM